MENEITIPESLPLLPMKDVVVFPHMVMPLYVGRPSSVTAIDRAIGGNRMAMFVTQIDASVDVPEAGDLYTMGTVGLILIIPLLTNSKTKSKTHTEAVCQNCGHRWKL